MIAPLGSPDRGKELSSRRRKELSRPKKKKGGGAQSCVKGKSRASNRFKKMGRAEEKAGLLPKKRRHRKKGKPDRQKVGVKILKYGKQATVATVPKEHDQVSQDKRSPAGSRTLREKPGLTMKQPHTHLKKKAPPKPRPT